ncbi:MAG TPA: cysteine desulfurase family protein [Candidatus Saccharimonadales bacterium]|nr:cysteine desulfurase family protein [Candidatus Saccharimonadales bacterium]
MSDRSIIYLDYASATPLDPQVLAAMEPYFSREFYNPSATYGAGRAARQALEAARAKAAHWLGARPAEVVFAAGGTEANNLAIHGVLRQFPEGNVVTAGTEHDSVLVPAGRYDCRQAAVAADGRLDLDDLARKIDDQTVLVSIAYANNEIGTVQALRQVAKVIAEKRAARPELPLYFHTDACQAANYLDLHAARLGVDLMTLDGSKIYGPKQSGILYVKAGTRLQPLMDGGHQELGLRGGTENVAGSIGFATALELVQETRRQEADRLTALRDGFMDQLQKDIPSLVINGSRKYRLPNNIHVTIPGQDNERLLFGLDEAGILAGAGSACNASDAAPSHVLGAIGLSEAEARASLRFALGRQTTPEMLDRAARTLRDLVQGRG